MITTRYAENLEYDPGLPFKFHRDIVKSPKIVSDIADWHEAIELQFCLEGDGYIVMNDESFDFSTGETAIIGSNIIHHTASDKNIIYDCLIIDAAFSRLIGIDVSHIAFRKITADTEIMALSRKFRDIYENDNDICRQAKLCGCIVEMLILLREKYTVSVGIQPSINQKNYEAVKRAIAYIRENYDTKLTLDDIAKNVFVGKSTLSREFSKMTGHTIVEYINIYRCKRASVLISSGMTVSEAAATCGFGNMSFFTRMFLRYMKCLPSKFKANQ